MHKRRAIEKARKIKGYRLFAAAYDLHYHLSAYPDRCYLLGRAEKLASESLADSHEPVFKDTEAVSSATRTTKITALRY